MDIVRTIEPHLEAALFQGHVIVLYGARQVGKTTLLRHLREHASTGVRYLNCDEGDVREALTAGTTSTALRSFIGDIPLVLIDEAQRVQDIGIKLKLLHDTYPDLQVVATGSSSFDLSNTIGEPLTGRARVFRLYPFSHEELSSVFLEDERSRLLEKRLIYGSYPSVLLGKGDPAVLLSTIVDGPLYKDVLAFQRIKHPSVLQKLLSALALQVGNEVSLEALGNILDIDRHTVNRYIDLLEQSFVVFRLPSLHRNKRTELKHLRKVYFYDTGIRNAVIHSLNPLSLRNDVGALWENFVIAERLKMHHNHGRSPSMYFWRTHQKQEIDCIEEEERHFLAIECKWKEKKWQPPKPFRDAYPNHTALLAHPGNIDEVLMPGSS